MSEGPQRSWWTTLPGILTGIAGLITAITGLVVALGALGVLGADDGSSPTVVDSPAAATGSSPTSPRPSTPTTGSADTHGAYAVEFPVNEVYVSGATSYTVLEVGAQPATDGQITLSFLVRAETMSEYELAFSDDTFRIDSGGDTYAPTSNLYEHVAGNASAQGTVTFVVPDDTRQADFLVLFPEGTRTVPFTVTAN